MHNTEFKEKSRRLMFNSGLKNFPLIFEMYVRSFGLSVDFDSSMNEILDIIRTSRDAETAYTMVCHYLDGLE